MDRKAILVFKHPTQFLDQFFSLSFDFLLNDTIIVNAQQKCTENIYLKAFQKCQKYIIQKGSE